MSLSALKDSWNSEITKFDRVVSGEENIGCFDVSVKHFPSVDVLQREAYLYEPIKDLFLWEVLFGIVIFLYMETQVPHYFRYSENETYLHNTPW